MTKPTAAAGEDAEERTAGTRKPEQAPPHAHRKGLKDDKFGGKLVKPGDVAQVDLKVSETVSHQPGRIPVIVIRGAEPGPTFYVTSAVHGDEINGVAIVRHLITGLGDGKLVKGTLIAVPVANRFGFDANDRYLPDRRDLNRSFPGDAKGHMAARIADHLFRKVVLVSHAGIDLHTAAAGNSNLCHIRGDADRAPVKELMRASGVPVLVHSDGPRGSLRRAATEAGVPSILFEAGEAGRFHRHAVAIGHHAVLQLLGSLGMVEGRHKRPPFQTLIHKSEWVRSDHGGILDLRVEPGDLIAKGQDMGTIYDPYGRHVDVVHADRSGVVLGVATDPLINPGMALVHVGEMEKTLQSAKDYVAGGGDLGYIRWKPPEEKAKRARKAKAGGPPPG
jgi:predicted deacylase